MTTSRRSSVPAMMFWILRRVRVISSSTGVPLMGKKRIRCSGGGNTVMALMRASSVWLVRSLIAWLRRWSCWLRGSCMSDCQGDVCWVMVVVRIVKNGLARKQKTAGIAGGFGRIRVSVG